MNKVQYIELLKLRGIIKLETGQSIQMGIEKSEGKRTEKDNNNN
jgi:hypothetical protein